MPELNYFVIQFSSKCLVLFSPLSNLRMDTLYHYLSPSHPCFLPCKLKSNIWQITNRGPRLLASNYFSHLLNKENKSFHAEIIKGLEFGKMRSWESHKPAEGIVSLSCITCCPLVPGWPFYPEPREKLIFQLSLFPLL